MKKPQEATTSNAQTSFPMVTQNSEAPIRGLRDIGLASALENDAIHYSPVTSMKSVWASPRWKISFSSTA